MGQGQPGGPHQAFDLWPPLSQLRVHRYPVMHNRGLSADCGGVKIGGLSGP